MPRRRAAALGELAVVLLGALAATCALTYPLVRRLADAGRVDTAEGRLSIWNVAWVARTLVVDPAHLFDANIFYPHRGTLAYSENNIGAGILALPAYWLSRRNPYAAHNVAVLAAFALSATGMYYLVRHLTRDRRAAASSAVMFAFTPHLFAHTAHIQLLMTAGLPFSMLALHRLIERPGVGRGVQLGLAMAAQAVSCGYYGVFVILMVGFAVCIAASFRRGLTLDHWKALAVGGVVSLAIVAPLYGPYARVQASGFTRDLGAAVRYSADWRAYLASAAYAHGWMLRRLDHWNEVLFPGILTIGLAAAGVWTAARRGQTELLSLYGGLAALAFWASLGPRAGLYAALYRFVPIFTWLRAPSRFGLLVAFGLSVLAGVGVSRLLPRDRGGALAGAALVVCAALELKVPFPLADAPALSPAYRVLRTLPRAPLIEMPFYYPEVGLFQHTIYMLSSTSHWLPLVNGYSDYIPPDFLANVATLAAFPTRPALKMLEPLGVRYAMFHMYGYNAENRREVMARLKEFEDYLRPLYVDEQTRLYEIVGSPP